MTIKTRMLIALGALLGALACSAAPAFAETLSPWFHMTSLSRPGNLQPGLGRSQVDEITTSPEVVFELTAENSGGASNVGTFATEPYFKTFHEQIPEATAENVQKALEKIYGDVVVSGTGPDHTPPLTVTVADRPIHLRITALAGTAQVNVLSVGRADAIITATAINLGDGTANVAASPLMISDTLPEHVKPRWIVGNTNNHGAIAVGPVECELGTLTCTFKEGCNPSNYCGDTHGGNGEFPPPKPSILEPYEEMEVEIGVELEPGASSGELNEASVSGGGAPPAKVRHPIVVSGSPTPFRAEDYELSAEEVGGTPDVQAGSHPFQFTTTLDLSQISENEKQTPAALAKDLHFELPAGLIGNPTAYPRCPLAQFAPPKSGAPPQCPADTQIGIATVTYVENFLGGLLTVQAPVYNLEPTFGEPARFAFTPGPGVDVFLDTSLRTGEDYGVNVTVNSITEVAGFMSNSVTFWGVPGDPRHNPARLTVGGAAEDKSYPPPLLSMPTSCTGELQSSFSGDSWENPGGFTTPIRSGEPDGVAMQSMDGCGLLPFSAEVKVSPDVDAGSTPSGLKVDVHVPQEEGLNGTGLAPAMLKNITVELPEGVALNPAAGDGLQACTRAEVGFTGYKELNPSTEPGVSTPQFEPTESSCPNASKIASVTVKSPLLPQGQYVKGFVYLAAPQNFSTLTGAPPENPFESLVAFYLVAKDPISGTLVKLPGSVSLNQSTGQITSTFASNPQLPFEDAELEFFGGERAPLVTPARCEPYTTNAFYEPWTNTASDHEVLHATSTFDITAGPSGSPCPGAALPFSPSLESETTNINAGGFTPLSTTLSREDGQQSLQSVTLHYPAGLSGLLSGVALCPEAQANAGTCGSASAIGETIVSVGLGGDPFTVTGGKVYITEKYDGAPFGLSIVNPAKAGPFDLQEGRPVVVRAKIEVNPTTAALTITTDPPGSPHAIPTIIEGFLLQIKHVNVTINRPGFTFNPTNCDPQSITGSIDSAEGASSPVSVPFQVTNCAALKFAPKFAVSTTGKTSKANGASLTATVSEPAGSMGSQSNIAAVKVDLPRALPSRLKTLQKACTNAQFELNPANCPSASFIGHAVVHTLLVPVPLEGPAIFVSHGGEAFPSLEIVLQGYGVKIVLVGATYISPAGITSTTFKTVPDAPFSSFELTLPEGPYSALAANGNLCALTKTVTVKKKVKVKVKGHEKTVTRKVKETKPESLVMPTAFVGQNGAEIHENTAISVTGCKKAAVKKAAKKKKKKGKKGSKKK